MKTVGDLVSVDFPLLWHEAVAVVQEVASHVSPDGGIPADTHLFFNEDGTITIGAASQSRVPVVTTLGRLLQRLLPGDAPPALRAFASENSSEQPTHPTLNAFTGALAFFERPGRAGHLLAVATRLQSYTPPPSSDEELDRLRKKVIEEFPDEASVSARFTRRSIHPAYAAGGALALVVVIAGAWLPVGGFFAALSGISLPGVGGTSSIAAAPPAADPIEQSGTPADVANAATDSPAAHRVAADRRRSVVPLRAASTVGSAGSPQAVATPLAVVNDPVSAGAPQVQPSAAPAAPNRDTTPHVDSRKIYSNEDPAVTPASLVHPQLPSEPQPGPSTGHFDLTVDESGNVVTVRLVSPARRYQEQLLVSAAKAWRFRPALLEGRPVKYRMRVPITLPEQQ